jgi:hypothetical protein
MSNPTGLDTAGAAPTLSASPSGEDDLAVGGSGDGAGAMRGSRRWSDEEHQRLSELVCKYGTYRSWTLIASNLPGRTGKQCRERWLNHLVPNIKKVRARGSWYGNPGCILRLYMGCGTVNARRLVYGALTCASALLHWARPHYQSRRSRGQALVSTKSLTPLLCVGGRFQLGHSSAHGAAGDHRPACSRPSAGKHQQAPTYCTPRYRATGHWKRRH